MIEEINDISEDMADHIGIYNAHEDGEERPCRCCFVGALNDRIRAAQEIEKKLSKGAPN